MKLHTWFYIFLMCWQPLLAQESSLQQLIDGYAAEYMNLASKHAVIFSGDREQSFGFATLNHPYFKEQNFATGRLSYDGIIYPEVQLRWNLYRDELLIFSPVHYSIVLKNENIDFIEMHGYHIFPFYPDSLPGCPAAGNYILLYSGDCMVIEKINTGLLWNDEDVIRKYYYTFSPNFYLLKDGVYYRINSKRALLKTLETHRKELRRFIRTYDSRYRDNTEKIIVGVVKKHERLVRQ